jgi:hypothetical protein
MPLIGKDQIVMCSNVDTTVVINMNGDAFQPILWKTDAMNWFLRKVLFMSLYIFKS